MNQYCQIGEAARRAGVTIETLRHYDRIGLLSPGKVDPQTGYRYYSDFEIDQAQVIHYLRSINLPLSTIKKLFQEDDIPAAMEVLKLACDKVDKEIEHLLSVKQHLQDTLDNYSTKRNTRNFIKPLAEPAVQELPARTVFLARGLHEPTLGNLSQLYSTVERQISPEIREQFQFENAAGALVQGQTCTLFALCVSAAAHPNVAVLPGGRYLCVSCPSQDYRDTVEYLRRLAVERFQAGEGPVVLDVIFTGIIQWEYEVKLFLGPYPPRRVSD